jgi:coenzyme F420 hydrogenase subunit beta
MDVLQEVVTKGWCIGCGMCAAICPMTRLAMQWNDRGEYNPVEIENCAACPARCSLCYQVCPAHGNTKNETEIGREWYGDVQGIQHTDETGYYLSAYVGYSKKHRATGASGGMATWMLELLLSSKVVDAVAAVGRTANPDKLFEFKLCRNVDEVRACSRSAYYPVEISRVIQHILKNDGRYAIIGLPCVCKAIRLAQDKIPKLKKRIKYVLGLTCGHQSSKFFAEYICALGGGNPHELKEIVFRTKDFSQPASNLGISFRSGHGKNEVSKQVLWWDGVGDAYNNAYFQLPGCFYCDDVFAECADVVFMDAWLPEYAKQPEGHSLVLVRNLLVDGYIKKAMSNDLSSMKLPIEKVIKSQQGVLDRKRRRKPVKTTISKMRNHILNCMFPLMPNMVECYKSITIASSLTWMSNKDYSHFTKAMFPSKMKVFMYQQYYRSLNVIYKIILRVHSVFKS